MSNNQTEKFLEAKAEAEFEASRCKLWECDKPRANGFECCDNYHGYLFSNWKLAAQNWETIFSATSKGYINEVGIRNIPVSEYIYYANLLNA